MFSGSACVMTALIIMKARSAEQAMEGKRILCERCGSFCDYSSVFEKSFPRAMSQETVHKAGHHKCKHQNPSFTYHNIK